MFERGPAYPMLRYPWTDTRTALHRSPPRSLNLQAVQVHLCEPQTRVRMRRTFWLLRPDAASRPATQAARAFSRSVFHLIEGNLDVQVDRPGLRAGRADTCCAPGYTGSDAAANRLTTPRYIFIATNRRCIASSACSKTAAEPPAPPHILVSQPHLPLDPAPCTPCRCAAAPRDFP